MGHRQLIRSDAVGTGYPDCVRRLERLESEARLWVTAPAPGVPVRRISERNSLRLTSEVEQLSDRIDTYVGGRWARLRDRLAGVQADLDHAWDIAEGFVPPPRAAPQRRSVTDRLREEAAPESGSRWWDRESGRSRRVVSAGLPSSGRGR